MGWVHHYVCTRSINIFVRGEPKNIPETRMYIGFDGSPLSFMVWGGKYIRL